jgi:hypothetical protein
MDIIFPSSHWGSNIGNAFFHLGNKHIIEKACLDANLIQFDLRSEKAFMQSKKEFSLDSKYYENIEGADYLLLDGPMFDVNFRHLFGPILKRAKVAGVKVILMSTGGIEYSAEEIDHCRKVLSEYKPFILTTRDRETYQAYGDLAENSYDGICGAWFCPDFFPGIITPKLTKYITLCFDHAHEPLISMSSYVQEDKSTWSSVDVAGVKHSKLTKITRLCKRGGYPKEISGYEVIRPSHQVLHRPNWRLFFKENTFVSQTPYGYLNLYRNTSLTITDRLHAAVATLAYGNPARLYIKSKRPHLLNRIGAEESMSGVFSLDPQALAVEKNAYIEWMSNVLGRDS